MSSDAAAPAERRRRLSVPEGLDGLRLDVAMARLLGLSRTAAAELLDAGAVTVDDRPAARSDRVHAGAWLDVALPAPRAHADELPVRVPGLRVLLEDDDVIVVDKPGGVAVHPSPGWSGPTVTGGLAAAGHALARAGADERRGVVHRLDVGTTGVMVLAKSERAYAALKEAFRSRTVEKVYTALVQGHPDPSAGTIDAPIARHPTHDHRWAVVSGGRDSVTHYETMEAFRAASLLRVRLETGRTHQIRVHMAATRHPCVGDLMYGADPSLASELGLQRQWLHASHLGFPHPADDHWVAVDSDPAPDLQRALDRLSDS